MRDKGLSAFLMALFLMTGIAILVLAWVQPMPPPERILAICIGSGGPI